LPEITEDEWIDHFPFPIQKLFVYRLGNYTLIEDERNRASGNKNFAEKKFIYKTSQYNLSNQVVADEGTLNSLDSRQYKLADYASAIWLLPYFE
jgi:hypothetical protein